MKKIIYHGSERIIKKPEFGVGKKHNDYGQAFYCTFDLELAKEWAVDYARDGYANKYEIDTTNLKILNLNDYSPLYWLAILIDNRTFNISSPLGLEAREFIKSHFLLNYRDYDIIIGYRADDSYFAFARDFVSGVISFQQLVKAMKLGNLGQQFAVISKKAFESIKFIDYEYASNEQYFYNKNNRDFQARKMYNSTKLMKWNKKDIYIRDIMNGDVKENDPRLQ